MSNHRDPLAHLVRALDAEYDGGSVEMPDAPVEVVNNGATLDIADTSLDTGSGGDSPFQTEDENNEELYEQANYGPDGQPLGDLDRAWQYEQFKKAREDALVLPVSINPSSARESILGGEATLIPAQGATAVGNEVLLVQWNGEDKESCPVTVTAQTQPIPTTPAASTGVILPVLRIKWGTRNGQYQVDVDLAFGQQVTIEASSVYVSAFLDAGSDTQVNASASIGFRSAHRASPVLRTANLSFPGGGASQTIAVARPKFASTVFGFDRSDPTIAYNLNFLNLNNVLIMQRVIPSSAYLTSPIGIPNDCVAINVVGTPSGTDKARLIFGVL